MTNEEIIRHTRYLAKKHQDDTVLTFETNLYMAFTDIANHIEEQAEENTKLKAEIKQLNTQIAESNKEGVSILHDILELREENERLYATIGRQAKAKDALEEQVEQLKSELEQSVKLPCKVGNIVYAYSTYFGVLSYEINSIHVCCGISFEAIASRNDDMLDSIDFDIEDIGKTVFLTQEEAEQSLRRINEKL